LNETIVRVEFARLRGTSQRFINYNRSSLQYYIVTLSIIIHIYSQKEKYT